MRICSEGDLDVQEDQQQPCASSSTSHGARTTAGISTAATAQRPPTDDGNRDSPTHTLPAASGGLGTPHESEEHSVRRATYAPYIIRSVIV